MQISVPGRDPRNSQGLGYPQAKHPKIPRAGYMNQVRPELLELINYPLPVPAEQGIALQVFIQRERSPASIQFQCDHGTPATGSPRRADVNRTEETTHQLQS